MFKHWGWETKSDWKFVDTFNLSAYTAIDTNIWRLGSRLKMNRVAQPNANTFSFTLYLLPIKLTIVAIVWRH